MHAHTYALMERQIFLTEFSNQKQCYGFNIIYFWDNCCILCQYFDWNLFKLPVQLGKRLYPFYTDPSFCMAAWSNSLQHTFFTVACHWHRNRFKTQSNWSSI